MFKKIINSFNQQLKKIQEAAAVDAQIVKAAQDLFDNRLGLSDNRNPYAPREIWAKLGVALYGKDDKRVKELQEQNDKIDLESIEIPTG